MVANICATILTGTYDIKHHMVNLTTLHEQGIHGGGHTRVKAFKFEILDFMLRMQVCMKSINEPWRNRRLTSYTDCI